MLEPRHRPSGIYAPASGHGDRLTNNLLRKFRFEYSLLPFLLSSCSWEKRPTKAFKELFKRVKETCNVRHDPELLKCGAAKWCVFASKMHIVPNRIRESAVVRKSRGSPSVFGTSLRTGTRNRDSQTPGLYKVWTRQTKLPTRHTRSVAWWMNIGQERAEARSCELPFTHASRT